MASSEVAVLISMLTVVTLDSSCSAGSDDVGTDTSPVFGLILNAHLWRARTWDNDMESASLALRSCQLNLLPTSVRRDSHSYGEEG